MTEWKDLAGCWPNSDMIVVRSDYATVHRVIDIDPFVLPLGFLFPGATVEALAPHRESLDGKHVDMAAGNVLLAVQSHVIRFAGKTILIDTCVGEHKQRVARPAWHQRVGTSYLANLTATGYTPDDIDIVMCTHLHADHIGWNTRLESGRWVPTFARARYLISPTEIEHHAKEAGANPAANHGSYQDSILPVIERERVTATQPGDTIVDGGKILALPGHAPGQIGLEIAANKDEKLVFCGDAIHSPAQVYQPRLVERFLPRQGASGDHAAWAPEARRAENLRLIPAHLRGGIMRVREKNGGFVPQFDD